MGHPTVVFYDETKTREILKTMSAHLSEVQRTRYILCCNEIKCTKGFPQQRNQEMWYQPCQQTTGDESIGRKGEPIQMKPWDDGGYLLKVQWTGE
jgi:hypothetical protein